MRCLASLSRCFRSSRTVSDWFLLMKVVAMPVLPQRPVRPILCQVSKELQHIHASPAHDWAQTSCSAKVRAPQNIHQDCYDVQASPVHIVFYFLRHVIVNDMLNVREVQALGSNIRSDKHILAPLLEPVYGLIPLSLILATCIISGQYTVS